MKRNQRRFDRPLSWIRAGSRQPFANGWIKEPHYDIGVYQGPAYDWIDCEYRGNGYTFEACTDPEVIEEQSKFFIAKNGQALRFVIQSRFSRSPHLHLLSEKEMSLKLISPGENARSLDRPSQPSPQVTRVRKEWSVHS